MLILHFVDFEETLEIDQPQQIQLVIKDFVQEKKLPIDIKYHLFDEREEINFDQILSYDNEENKKIYILFILPHPIIFYFQEGEEQYKIDINLFDKIETLIQKLKQRFRLLGYTLELKYQNLDQNKSFYQIDKKVSKIQGKVKQKIYVQYQNKEMEFFIDMFIRIQDLYKYLKEQFQIKQNFKILYEDTEIRLNEENALYRLIQYQIPTGAQLIIQQIQKISIQIHNQVINENQEIILEQGNITVIEIILQIMKLSKLQDYDNFSLYSKNTLLINEEQINKYIGNSNQIIIFKQKIYDVEFYLCQQGIDFSKIKLRMKSNQKLIDVCQQSYFRDKKIKFFDQNIEINSNFTFQELKLIDQTTLYYQEIIEVIPILKPQIVKSELLQIELRFQYNGIIKTSQFLQNLFFSQIKQEILLMFNIKQNVNQCVFRCQNKQIIENQALEMIEYKQNDVIEIVIHQEPNQKQVKDEEILILELVNEKTQEKKTFQVKSNEQILKFKERVNLQNYILKFNKKILADEVSFNDRGIKNNSTIYYSEKLK